MITVAIMCMALNVYHEARGEPLNGQYAVAHVVMNRMADPRWADDVCGVIGQKAQFSWTRKHAMPRDMDALRQAIKVAAQVIDGRPDSTQGSTHYHNDTVEPLWTFNLTKTMKIGNHQFYK